MSDPTPESAYRVDHDDAERSYTISVGDQVIGRLEYRRSGQVLTMIHTEVDPDRQGQGVASALVQRALEDARDRGLHVVPTCPYVATWVDRHPDFADLIA